MGEENTLLGQATALVTYTVEGLQLATKELSRTYPGIENTFFDEAYVPTKKREQLLDILRTQIEDGTFKILYFIAPFGFGKTFFVERMTESISQLKFGKQYNIHVVPISMYLRTLNECIAWIIGDIAENVLSQDCAVVTNNYFSQNLARLDEFSLELREKAKKKELITADLENEIIAKLGINDLMDFITDLLRQSFDQKGTVCIFVIDELERVSQEDRERISGYKLLFSKLIRQSIELPYWKLILSAPLEITEHETKHPLLDVLFQDAADRLRDFDKEQYRLLFEVSEAIQFMQGMLNKSFLAIANRNSSQEAKKWLRRLENEPTFPVDDELLEILARMGLKQVGEKGLIQDFRSYIALVTDTIKTWLKYSEDFLNQSKPPINFTYFNEFSKEIQEGINSSVDAATLGGINKAVFKYNIDEFLKTNIENRVIVDFLLSITERMKLEKKRKNNFDLTLESKKHQFNIDTLISELEKAPDGIDNAFNVDTKNNVLNVDMDELGKLVLADIPAIPGPTGADPFSKCVQEVKNKTFYDILKEYFAIKGAVVNESEKTITINSCTFGGRIIIFDRDSPPSVAEKIKRNIDGLAIPAFALKIDETNPKWPNSKEFFIVPKWMEMKAEEILQFEKYEKKRTKSMEPLTERVNDFRARYNINSLPELEQIVLYKVPLWYQIHGRENEPLPTPPFLDIGGIILDDFFLDNYTDTKITVEEFVRYALGIPLPKTQIIVSLFKFFLTNFGKSLGEYDESSIHKNKRVLSEYDDVFKKYTFRGGKYSKFWTGKPPSQLEEITKEFDKIGYVQHKIVANNYENFCTIGDLPDKTKQIIKVLSDRLDKEKMTLPKLCEVIYGFKPKEDKEEVYWEEPERVDSCILICIICMANLYLTLEVKDKKIFLNKDILTAKKAKLSSEINKMLIEEFSWTLFNNKELDLSYLRKQNKQLSKATKVVDVEEVAKAISSCARRKLSEEEVGEATKKCYDLITNILTERVNLINSTDRDKTQQFYVEVRNWLSQMDREKRQALLLLLWHLFERLRAVSNHLTYVGKAKAFNKKLENSRGLLGAYSEFDTRDERSSSITATIDRILEEYGEAWFTKSDLPSKFETKMENILVKLGNEQVDCKETINDALDGFIPQFVTKPDQIMTEIKNVEGRDKELDNKLNQYMQSFIKTIEEKETILARYEDVKKWKIQIAGLKRTLGQLKTSVEEFDLESEDLGTIATNVKSKLAGVESELNAIVDLNEDQKRLYTLAMNNDRSFVAILKNEGITDFAKQREQVIDILEKLIQLRNKTGVEIRL